MSVLLPFISFLLVTAAGGRPHANLPSADGTIVPNSASTAIAYWQTMLPNSPMPSAILELLTPSAGDDQKDPCPFPFPLCFNFWGPNTKGDDEKMRHGLQGINKKSAASSRGDDQKDPWPCYPFPFCVTSWGPNTKGDDEKMRHGLQGINKKGAASSRDRHDHAHGDSHSHGLFNFANLIFLEDVLIPGSTITPYIQPATSRAPLLHREVADSIPMSTKNFTDILKMFAPASLAMADDIWSTLDLCENPRYALKGEKRAWATSIESMVEFAISVLGTHDVQAFSSDVPAEGVTSRRYKVAAVRTLTDSGDTMTCHGVTFPYAVFYCHAVNPTKVYMVTLESEDGGAHKMEALAVCHLDTSQFDPKKMPQHVKPGDAAVCHFISRDSVLWAPAARTQGDGQVAAAQ